MIYIVSTDIEVEAETAEEAEEQVLKVLEDGELFYTFTETKELIV